MVVSGRLVLKEFKGVDGQVLKPHKAIRNSDHQQRSLRWLILSVNLPRSQRPDSGPNIILDGSVKVIFLTEINIQISGLWVKQIALNNLGGPHPTS